MYRPQTPEGWTQVDVYARLFYRNSKLAIETLPEAPMHLNTMNNYPETMWSYDSKRQRRIVLTVYLDGVPENDPFIPKIREKLWQEFISFTGADKPLI